MQVEKQDAVPAVEATQAAPEAPETTSEATATTETTGNDDEPQPQSRRKQDGVQKRFSELTREKYEERRKRESAEFERDEARRQLEEARQAKQSAAAQKPNSYDFSDPDEYQEAFVEWKATQLMEQREQRRAAEQTKATEAARQREFRARVDAQVDKGRAKFADFEEKVIANLDLAITPSMVEAIAELEEGADVAYYLGNNPEEAASIAAMTPLRQAVALGRIESKLASTPPAKKVTGAPAPVASKVNGGGSPSAKDISKMNDDELAAHTRRQFTRQ